MDDLTQKAFDKVVKKSIPELSEDDILFLRARRSYLTIGQKKDFAKVLEVKETKKKKK